MVSDRGHGNPTLERKPGALGAKSFPRAWHGTW